MFDSPSCISPTCHNQPAAVVPWGWQVSQGQGQVSTGWWQLCSMSAHTPATLSSWCQSQMTHARQLGLVIQTGVLIPCHCQPDREISLPVTSFSPPGSFSPFHPLLLSCLPLTFSYTPFLVLPSTLFFSLFTLTFLSDKLPLSIFLSPFLLSFLFSPLTLFLFPPPFSEYTPLSPSHCLVPLSPSKHKLCDNAPDGRHFKLSTLDRVSNSHVPVIIILNWHSYYISANIVAFSVAGEVVFPC